ncbi:transmembrane protein 144-like [Pelomyxa schiedti]|nr:transmembrane protein 144-like [Pelomyxa schiedti]
MNYSSSESSLSDDDTSGVIIGSVALSVSVMGFGTFLLPVKKVPTGDGVFFQWVMCCGIWCVGLSANAAAGFPKFEPLSMLGGLLWCTGNVLAVPIIKLIGLGLGLCLWGVTGFLIGWMAGTLGLFGINQQEVKTPAFNYVGAALSVCAILLFALIKTQPSNDAKIFSSLRTLLRNRSATGDTTALLENVNIQTPPKPTISDWALLDRLSPLQKRICGVVLALLSGVFYGLNFIPSQYLIDHGDGGLIHSSDGIDYVFSHFSGILAASTLYLLLYCVAMKNKPVVFERAVLPGAISGFMFGISEACMFVANVNLMLVVTFPVASTGPAIVGTLCGIILFREVTGIFPLVLVAIAFSVTLVGVTFITLSQVVAL